jgi:CRISPR-associated endoribonuclease Cas6
MSLIKEAIEISDADYKESLYPDKNSEHSKIVKPFCFSVSMPSGKTAQKEKIIIDEGVEIEDTVFYFHQNNSLSFYISSPEYQFMVCLYNGLLEMKSFPFGNGINLKLERVFMLNEAKINGDEAIFRTNAPVLVEDKNNRPVLPLTDSVQLFNEHFNAIHERILKNIRGKGLYKEMEFVPVKLKKQVVKHTLKGFREKTEKPYMTFTCFEGCFKLKGDPRDLQMLYQTGIGLRTGQGFGMVDIV